MSWDYGTFNSVPYLPPKTISIETLRATAHCAVCHMVSLEKIVCYEPGLRRSYSIIRCNPHTERSMMASAKFFSLQSNRKTDLVY